VAQDKVGAGVRKGKGVELVEEFDDSSLAIF
jgi:hypothetical protein